MSGSHYGQNFKLVQTKLITIDHNFSLKGFFVAVIFCFLNGEVSYYFLSFIWLGFCGTVSKEIGQKLLIHCRMIID